MSKYELAVVVNAQIDDEARTAVVDRCKNLITRFGGEIGEIEDWGKKKLIESRMRIMDNVIRYLCVKKDEA